MIPSDRARTAYDLLRSELMNKRLKILPSSGSFADELRHFDQRVDRMRVDVRDHVNDAMLALAMAIWQDTRSVVDRLADLARDCPSRPTVPGIVL